MADEEKIKQANDIVNLLENEQWSDLRSRIAAPLRWFIPTVLLEKTFTSIYSMIGIPCFHNKPLISNGRWWTRAKVATQFLYIKLVLTLDLTASGKLLFLRVWTSDGGKLYKEPAYSDRASFEETQLKVGPANLQVPGALTLPLKAGRHPCIILVAGTGPVDMDESVDAAKPFKDLAYGLATHGIATIRFEKVTKTHAKKCKTNSFTFSDEYIPYARDAFAKALAHDKIHPEKIFFLGHSQGGFVVPQIVAEEPRSAGCILISPAAYVIYHNSLKQFRKLALMKDPTGSTELAPIKALEKGIEVAEDPKTTVDTDKSTLPFGVPAAYWLDMQKFDPVAMCAKLDRPVLILQAGRDFHCPADDDFVRFEERLRGRQDVEMKVYRRLNHLFADMGEGPATPAEYDIPANVEQRVVDDIAEWVAQAGEKM